MIIWVSSKSLNAPLVASTPEKLIKILNQFAPGHGELLVTEGRQPSYRISAKVAGFLAGEILQGRIAMVSICGEAYPIETAKDCLDLLRTVRTERLYLDGFTVRSSATTTETAVKLC